MNRRKRRTTAKSLTKVRISSPLILPLHCLTPDALRSLATAIDNLTASHKKAGGTSPHAPCLSTIGVERSGIISAHVTSNGNHYKMLYSHGSWDLEKGER